jgi:hypothetical protein
MYQMESAQKDVCPIRAGQSFFSFPERVGGAFDSFLLFFGLFWLTLHNVGNMFVIARER